MTGTLVTQTDPTPSRKVAAMTMAIALWEVIWMVFSNAFPTYASFELKAGLTPVIGLAIGYFVRDNANIQVTQEVVATDVVVVPEGGA